MKGILSKVLILLMVMMLPMGIQAKEKSEKLNYDIEGAGTGQQGTYLVKVTVIGSKKIEEELVRRCAVHGVLFRGFQSTENRQSQRPLAGSAANEAEHVEFYNEFFAKNGAAKNYASCISSQTAVKSGKEYRVTVTVSVMKDQLLRDLQAAGVIRSLNSGF